MRGQAASDKPVAAAIPLSVNASSFGAISRLNQASSRQAALLQRVNRAAI
jgi:hypothetical protein